MTVINFALEDQSVDIVTDTLAIARDDQENVVFSTKFWPLPHLDGLICGTGSREFISWWASFVNAFMRVHDMVHLDEFAPDILREQWASFRDRNDYRGTTTIYHFGYDWQAQKFAGFAYRSADDFASYRFPCAGQAVKPPLAGWERFDRIPADMVAAVLRQKEEDDLRPFNGEDASEGGRVGIGGKLIHARMINSEGRIVTSIQCVHDF